MAISLFHAVEVGLLGLLTTSLVLIGAALGLYLNFSRRVLACILAFAGWSPTR